MQTAWLAPEFLVSMDSSPHLWFCAFKTATFRPNFLCLWGPDLPCDLLHANSVRSIRITSLYVSQPSSVVCSLQNIGFWTQITNLCGSQTSPVALCTQNIVSGTRITSLCGSQPSSVAFAYKTASFGQAYKSLWVPVLTCHFVHTKQCDMHLNY